jgi:hypothetical protein
VAATLPEYWNLLTTLFHSMKSAAARTGRDARIGMHLLKCARQRRTRDFGSPRCAVPEISQEAHPQSLLLYIVKDCIER